MGQKRNVSITINIWASLFLIPKSWHWVVLSPHPFGELGIFTTLSENNTTKWKVKPIQRNAGFGVGGSTKSNLYILQAFGFYRDIITFTVTMSQSTEWRRRAIWSIKNIDVEVWEQYNKASYIPLRNSEPGNLFPVMLPAFCHWMPKTFVWAIVFTSPYPGSDLTLCIKLLDATLS